MIAFTHTALGVEIGLFDTNLFSQTNPLIGLPLTATTAFFSHYLADLIPHGHFFNPSQFSQNVFKVIFLDLIASVFLFLTVTLIKFGPNLQFWYVSFGIVGSQLPDIIDGLIDTQLIPKKGILNLEYNLHLKTHWHGTGENTLLIGVGDIFQLALILAAIFSLLSTAG